MEQPALDKIEVTESIFLSPPERTDIPALVLLLGDREIYERTIMIPYPYTEHDAESFIRLSQLRTKAYGKPLDWAIRAVDGMLMGMIGFHGASQYDPAREEIGYWLGKAFWNKGIMTSVLTRFAALGFETYGFERLELPVFSTNEASKRVAEKSGFRCEATLKAARMKDGAPIDVDLYVRIRD